MTTESTPTPPSEPARSRAVFSTADFTLLRTAVLFYLEQGPAGPDRDKLGALFHRLGRLG